MPTYPLQKIWQIKEMAGWASRIAKALLICGFACVAAKGQDGVVSSSNTSARPNSAKGIVETQRGRIDAVRQTLDLNFPLGPSLPGRIKGGMAWTLEGWNGTNGIKDIRPVRWPVRRGSPLTWDIREGDSVTFDLFGGSQTFFLTAPGAFSSQEVVNWLIKRGINPPTDVTGYRVFSSSDGTAFYLEGGGSGRIFKAAIQGDQAASWCNDRPYFTRISNIWGDRVFYEEFWSNTSPYLTIIMGNDDNIAECVRLDVEDGSSPLGVNPLILNPQYPYPFGTGIDPISTGLITLPPFHSVGGDGGQIRISNGMGRNEVIAKGRIGLLADSYMEKRVNGNSTELLDDYCYTGIFDVIFEPTQIEEISSFGNSKTIFNWTDWQWASSEPVKLTIEYPSGLIESFVSAYNLSLTAWSPSLLASSFDKSRFDGFDSFFFLCLKSSNVPMGNSLSNGIVQYVRADTNGIGQTSIITHVTPRISYSGTPYQEGIISFPQPKHITNILTYPTTQVTTSSPFRGIRLVHAGGRTWTMAESQGLDAYLFYSSAVLEAQEIHGTGAPYATSSDRSVLEAGQDWDPSGFIIDSFTRYDGWELKTRYNPSGNPLKQGVNPVAQKITTVIGEGGVPRLPITTAISGDSAYSGSRDAWGPIRFDSWVVPPSGNTVQPIAPGTAVPAYQWATAMGNGSGSIQSIQQTSRHWDASLGKLLDDGMTDTLAGTALPTLREGAVNPITLRSSTFLRDSHGRITQVQTNRGGSTEVEIRQYVGNGPVPSTVTRSLSSPELGSPSFSGQVGSSYTLDTHDWVMSETDRLTQRTTTYWRNLMGQITNSTDLSTGITTKFTYDDRGRISSKIREATSSIPAEITSYTYDPNGRWKEETLSVAGATLVTRKEFDAFGRLTRVVNPDGSDQRYDYDEWGQLKSRSPFLKPGQAPYGDFSFSYDVKGRLIEEKNPNGQVLKRYPEESHWGTLTADGQTITGTLSMVVDDRGGTLMEVKDLLGQRIAVIDENNHVTRFTFDKWGNLSGTNNGGQIRRYAYNDVGWLISREEPEEGLTVYSDFTVLGTPRTTTLKGRSLGSMVTLTKSLDPKHRVDAVQTNQNGVQTQKTITYRDDFSVPTRVVETQPYGTLQEDYLYDDLGRPTGKTVGDGTRSFTVNRTLDAAGNSRRQVLSPGNGWPDQVQSFEYDSLLRPKQASFNCLVRGLMTYDQVSGSSVTDLLTYGNGASTKSVMNRGELVLTEHATAAGPFLPTGLERNPITWSVGGLMLSRGEDQFSYDALRRLSYAKTKGTLGEFAEQWFQYDRFGNRISTDFTYNAGPSGISKPDEVLAWRTQYDLRNNLPGQITGLVPGSALGQPGGGTIQSILDSGAQYDDFGRITTVNAIPGLTTSRTSWEYDGMGRIFREFVNQVPTTFLLDDDGLRFKRMNQDGTLQYTIYGFEREPLMVLKVETGGTVAFEKAMLYAFGKLISEESPTGTHFIQTDQVGSPNLITDMSAQVTGRAKNLPFGERFGQFGDRSIRRFTNHEDQEGSAIYMQARMYLPVYGRFAQVDPKYDQKLYTKDSWNLYGYVSNNPVTNTDPTGEEDGSNSFRELGGEQSNGDSTKELKDKEKAEEAKRRRKGQEEKKNGAEIGNFLLGLVEGFVNSVGMGVPSAVLPAAASGTSYDLGKVVGDGVAFVAGGALTQGGATVAVGGVLTGPGEIALAPAGAATAAAGVAIQINAGIQTVKDVTALANSMKGGPSSTNQLQTQHKKGQAPDDVTHVDRGSQGKKTQDHVHFKDGSLNRDGTLHDKRNGVPNVSKESWKWLINWFKL